MNQVTIEITFKNDGDNIDMVSSGEGEILDWSKVELDDYTTYRGLANRWDILFSEYVWKYLHRRGLFEKQGEG